MLFKIRSNVSYPTEYEDKGCRLGIAPGGEMELEEKDFLPNEHNEDLIKRGIISIVQKVEKKEKVMKEKNLSFTKKSKKKVYNRKEDS